MNNSNKLKEDIAKHRGFTQHETKPIDPKYIKGAVSDGTHPIWAGTFVRPDRKQNHIAVSKSCSHSSKRKEGITTLFWVCNQCGKDLGNV